MSCGVVVQRTQMEDLPLPSAEAAAPSVIEAGAPEAESKNDGDSSSEDEPWPGPLVYLQIVVGGISKCWDWLFSWTIPECDTEEEREAFEKMAPGAAKDAKDK